ncbi:MAG TPA: hypothetical protein VGR61_00220 [Candidatus Dormibacteraeota bacterium]|nr:hypothetical protein [Candidatus Dormibacteraeota bacterium]
MASGERTYYGTRARKLGAKPGMRALLVDVPDESLAAELEEAGMELVNGPRVKADVVFVGVRSVAELAKITRFKARIPKDGTLWLIRPKGQDTPVSERAAMEAGLASGLVDVKVVSFSETHSALKYVYRLHDR